MISVHSITPQAKPRITRQGRFSDRAKRYYAYKDEIRLKRVRVPPGGAHVTFVIPMPRSWSKKKRAKMNGAPHQQRPDADNLGKGLLDALYEDDSCVWDLRLTKIWGTEGEIRVRW